MKTIAVISQKGGAGKTTVAVHLAVCAEQNGHRVAPFDLDPQASAAKWADHRGGNIPEVVSAQAARLPQLLAVARTGGAGLAIIDTAPNSDSSALIAAKAADFILIPCRPSRCRSFERRSTPWQPCRRSPRRHRGELGKRRPRLPSSSCRLC